MLQEPQFHMAVERRNGEATVKVGGELDMGPAPRLRECIINMAKSADPPKRVVLDMADLDFIDSTGISVMVGALKRLQHQGGDMVLRAPTRRVRKVLELTGLNKLFDIESGGFG